MLLRGAQRAGAGPEALEGSSNFEALKRQALYPRLSKGWRRQEALRSLKGWHWLKGAERVGAGSEALKGPAAPGSLEDPAMTEALKMGKAGSWEAAGASVPGSLGQVAGEPAGAGQL